MPIRAVMLDVDGVLLNHPQPRGWSVNLERDLGLSPARLQELFFTPHWDDIIHGRAKLRDRLVPVLADIAPNIPCDTLVDYWFRNDGLGINRPLLDEVAQLREMGIPVHLATVQEHERARYLWEALDFRSHFEVMHYAADLGAPKPHPDFYAQVEARTGFAPGDIFFTDDRQENVDAARARGWHAAQWTGETTLTALLTQVA